MIPVIGFFDLTLATLYLLLIYVGAVVYRNKKIKTNPEYKYFIGALTAKIIGGVGFAVFSIYYYKGGDTFVFFNAADGLSNYLFTDFGKAIDVFFTSGSNINLDRYNFSPSYNFILKAEDVLTIVKITSLINVFCFSSYLTVSIFFALLSFLGLWFGYSNLCKLYPQSSKYMLIAFFFIPTALLWSSGILKDTVTQGCIGWLLYGFSNLFIFKRKLLFSIFAILIVGFIIFFLKPYLLYVLLPCLFIWVQSKFKNMIKSSFFRAILKPFLIVLLIGVGAGLFQKISDGAGKYSAENMEKTLGGFHSWHEYLAEKRDQSGYSLGEVEYTPLGVLEKAPAALNVTFFRPYLWQARNVPTLLGAIEGLILLVYFLYLLFTLRISFFRIIFKNNEILFLMLFAIIFGVVVGISSYNYGALSRYKIPAVMFFILALILIQNMSERKKVLS